MPTGCFDALWIAVSRYVLERTDRICGRRQPWLRPARVKVLCFPQSLLTVFQFNPQESVMARKQKLDFSKISETRKKEGLNQKDFWARYGVTQSGGSRYESGRSIPKPLALLLWLHRQGTVTDKNLADATKR